VGGGGRGIGLGSIVIALVAGWALGINPMTILGVISGGDISAPQVQQAPAQRPPADDRMAQFVSTVLADTEDVWRDVFKQGGAQYQEPKLVLFRGATPTACGTGQSASGPFYCPGDEKVYIDLSFFDQLHRQFGAPGDFAQAYVIAHEIGHHVQNVQGTEQQVRRLQQENPRAKNALSVAMELQADCYAGVWAHDAARARMLEPGDLEEGLGAAAAVGDDRLQQMAGGRVQRESFTHGSSADRQQWFRRGFEQGDAGACDTFAAMR
jgi:predicted metalloprotease